LTTVIREIQSELDTLRTRGTYKEMLTVDGPMGPMVRLADGREVVNLCSNNYLGLADHPEVVAGAKDALVRHGFGTASVRFICGTMALHEQLETALAEFCGQEKATTFVSCWNANEALVATLLREGDAVISDELNHASIIDGCRLCGKGVRRLVYRHGDMDDLDAKLTDAADAGRKLVITDGVFSMEGDLADLPAIVDRARSHKALVAVDDSHAHGVLGRRGRGTPEHFGVKVDIVTGTLGKALGGAAGGFIASWTPIIELMTQRARPQLFSNSLPPAVTGGALAAITLLNREPHRVGHLQENVGYLRKGLKRLGYEVIESPTAILPILIGDTARAIHLARALLEQGVLVVGFGYPVVPEGKARLRIQVCATHTRNHLDKALAAFEGLRKQTPALQC